VLDISHETNKQWKVEVDHLKLQSGSIILEWPHDCNEHRSDKMRKITISFRKLKFYPGIPAVPDPSRIAPAAQVPHQGGVAPTVIKVALNPAIRLEYGWGPGPVAGG
jgi:hypothetical protein